MIEVCTIKSGLLFTCILYSKLTCVVHVHVELISPN